MSQAGEVLQSELVAGAERSGEILPCSDLMFNKSDVRVHFETLADPRRGKVTYPLINVVVMMLSAVICGADDFVAVATWSEKRRDWLAKFLDMSSGVPSHDRFNAILGALNPASFQQCLLSWITSLHEITSGQVVAIDGKTIRRSFDRLCSKSAIHMVSAWATANRISLAQVVTDQKSNEITAIPQVLDLVDVEGSIVTIDAMGCQVEIIDKIVSKKATACVAVKANQPKLHEAIVNHFDEVIEAGLETGAVRHLSTHEKGHGRKEDRTYVLCPVPESVKQLKRWPHVKAIGMTSNITIREGREHTDIRYYVLTRYISGKRFADAVRSHWSVENNLHWQLDVSFNEDQCRIRKGHADANFSLIRRFSLGMLKNEKSARLGIKNKRLLAAVDPDYLAKVLFAT